MLKFENIDAKLIEVIAKPYSVSGNEGVSYKLRFLISDEIFLIKSNKEQVEQFETLSGRVGKVTLSVTSPKEIVSISVDSFTPLK